MTVSDTVTCPACDTECEVSCDGYGEIVPVACGFCGREFRATVLWEHLTTPTPDNRVLSAGDQQFGYVFPEET